MKKIPLSQGRFTLVDDADYEWLNQWRWYADGKKNRATSYAMRNFSDKTIRMHRLILGLKPENSKQGDHIDGNGLNNQRFNLRICTNQQNQFNQRPQKNRSSRFKGVQWHIRNKIWVARLQYNKHDIHIGCFVDEKEAARAYDKVAIKYFGEFAYYNFPKEVIC